VESVQCAKSRRGSETPSPGQGPLMKRSAIVHVLAVTLFRIGQWASSTGRKANAKRERAAYFGCAAVVIIGAAFTVRRADEILSSPQSCWIWPTPQTIRPWIPRDQGSLPCLNRGRPRPAWYRSSMSSRLRKFFWLMLDHVMPDGPPVCLTFVILLLVILNGITALSRW
jgi:hypothetical protein